MLIMKPIEVDVLPDSCTSCEFNMTKYCSALMCVKEENRKGTFVQNNRTERDKYCPLVIGTSF